MAVDLNPTDRFADRHIGPSASDVEDMLTVVGASSLDTLVDETVPESIRLGRDLHLPPALTEHELLAEIQAIAGSNKQYRSFIGMGYYGTLTPPVIQRGILENPNWYTQYTPYQAEIAQGRLEALLNFQTMVSDLTGLEIANASLLDEGTAAAEGMSMIYRKARKRVAFFVDENCHPQTIEVVRTRAEPMGIGITVGDVASFEMSDAFFGVLIQYPETDGRVVDHRALCQAVHDGGGQVVVASDLLALTLLEAPGEFGADVVVGSSQRFGVPMGFGGPHAAFFATRDEFKRSVPGRIIGVTVDADGGTALRMALQTREQHIRRDKATSNICTAQVLLAVTASMYAVFHGPRGLKAIAKRVHDMTKVLARMLVEGGLSVRHADFFDTLRIDGADVDGVRTRAEQAHMNLRYFDDGSIGVSLDQASTQAEIELLAQVLTGGSVSIARILEATDSGYDGAMPRTTGYLEHPVFNTVHSETDMLRYMQKLSSRDLSLTTSMIPLGSCTMKLNATAELMPITWAGLNSIHPFAPSEQVPGYHRIISDLENWLGEITGLPAVSLQPNSGAAGEYTGLLTIRAYHQSRGEGHRDVCLIPSSAHGTNPASAVMAGMQVVVVNCDENGNVDIADLEAKATEHAEKLSALMITYPSTHGVFERGIRQICQIVHDHGGQVYMDGANMNAQVGLCRPGDFGADVCHLNLHKTFAIPHGGGGPGIGPICAQPHLGPFMPGHPLVKTGGAEAIGPVASAPFGSAGVLVISWAYIAMLGADGLKRSSQVAILNANYMAKRLEGTYDVLYTGPGGRVAHEFILDLRHLRQHTSLTEVDVAKRLMDYGFHAPTMSWPVVGTVMVEPTESEAKAELDRFCEAMISIRSEIQEVELGIADAERNVLSQAPHTAAKVLADEWEMPYPREKAAYPAPWTREHKFWPTVRRVNDAQGDRQLVCTCPPIEAYQD
ncbi:MAG: aminomethyl-transferring glycine dehydrogenase [Rhodothermales bacterium]|nr:aminomethyl-transferring glycine dehydrogenase [Rhodothermales bacterium]MBO6779033.1 aminomethyl-transferring glycine dehydrogenase [Rhodothermales bacterium]